MLGRSLQTSTFVIDQAGANRVKYLDSIYPQNNQVSDIVYGQSTGGQAPVNTYNPYYPKIERTMERKITPQDVFRAQNKQVQKLVTSARLSNLPQWMEAEKPSLGEVKQEPSPRYEDDSTSFGTASQGTFEASSMSSSLDTVSQWLGTQIQDVSSTASIIETTNPIEDERVSLEVEDDLQASPKTPVGKPGLWSGLGTPVFSRKNRPPPIQTQGISPRIKEFIENLPLEDENVRTAAVDLIQQISDNAAYPVVDEALENLKESLKSASVSPSSVKRWKKQVSDREIENLASRLNESRQGVSPRIFVEKDKVNEVVKIFDEMRKQQGIRSLEKYYGITPDIGKRKEISETPPFGETFQTKKKKRIASPMKEKAPSDMDLDSIPSPASSGDVYVPSSYVKKGAKKLPKRQQPKRNKK